MGMPETAGVTDTTEPAPKRAKQIARKMIDGKKTANKINTKPVIDTKGSGSNSPLEADPGQNEFADKKVN